MTNQVEHFDSPKSSGCSANDLQSVGHSMSPKLVLLGVQLPLGTHRAVFLSGMSGAEVQEVISAYLDAGMPNVMKQ